MPSRCGRRRFGAEYAAMSAGPTLLAFDFDGTLAPICDDPGAVRLHSRAHALLAATSRLEGLTTAILSGRDTADLERRVDVPGVYLVSAHGLVIQGPGRTMIREGPPLGVPIDAEVQHEIEVSGMLLERKTHAVALHWRGIPFEAIGPVVNMFRNWATGAALHLIEGRCVVEARVPGAGKEEALRWLTSAVGASRVVYAGDDFTDFGPLRFAAERGRGFFIASSEREPPPGVTVVASFRQLFRLVREEILV